MDMLKPILADIFKDFNITEFEWQEVDLFRSVIRTNDIIPDKMIAKLKTVIGYSHEIKVEPLPIPGQVTLETEFEETAKIAREEMFKKAVMEPLRETQDKIMKDIGLEKEWNEFKTDRLVKIIETASAVIVKSLEENSDKPNAKLSQDNVNHPSHYNSGRIEVIEAIEDWKLGYHLGNTVKYIARAGKKDPTKVKEDLLKARWFLNREIELLEASETDRLSVRPNDMPKISTRNKINNSIPSIPFGTENIYLTSLDNIPMGSICKIDLIKNSVELTSPLAKKQEAKDLENKAE